VTASSARTKYSFWRASLTAASSSLAPSPRPVPLAMGCRTPGPSRNRDSLNVGREQDHSGLIPANFTTLPHFSTSSEMIFPKAAGEPPSRVPPRSAIRVMIGRKVDVPVRGAR
jgi:hypothetical protein